MPLKYKIALIIPAGQAIIKLAQYTQTPHVSKNQRAKISDNTKAKLFLVWGIV